MQAHRLCRFQTLGKMKLDLAVLFCLSIVYTRGSQETLRFIRKRLAKETAFEFGKTHSAANESAASDAT